MTNQLPMIVKFEVKKGMESLVKEELLKMVEITLKEDGCVAYDLYQDAEDPTVFMFYEVWATYDAWKKHDQMPHVNVFREATKVAILKISANKLNRIK